MFLLWMFLGVVIAIAAIPFAYGCWIMYEIWKLGDSDE